MRHTQEQLAHVLNEQYQRGVRDAAQRCTYGYSSRDTLYPSYAHPDITQQAARQAYDQGWAGERRRMKTRIRRIRP